MLIAHISDLHVARSPGFGEYNPKRVLGYINYRLFRGRRYREAIAREALERLAARSPDLVLLTGDMTQHGLDAEFDAVAELLSVLGRKNIPVVAVAGNHDLYGRAGLGRLQALVRDVALGLESDGDGVMRLGDVELLPLSQGISTHLPFVSFGRQDCRELERAAAGWSGEPTAMRLVCGHYPVIDSHGGRLLYFRGLREADSLMAFCGRCRVAAYFCGHDHKRFAVPMPGGCVQYVAPALSAVRGRGSEWVGVYECAPGMAHPGEVAL